MSSHSSHAFCKSVHLGLFSSHAQRTHNLDTAMFHPNTHKLAQHTHSHTYTQYSNLRQKKQVFQSVSWLNQMWLAFRFGFHSWRHSPCINWQLQHVRFRLSNLERVLLLFACLSQLSRTSHSKTWDLCSSLYICFPKEQRQITDRSQVEWGPSTWKLQALTFWTSFRSAYDTNG